MIARKSPGPPQAQTNEYTRRPGPGWWYYQLAAAEWVRIMLTDQSSRKLASPVRSPAGRRNPRENFTVRVSPIIHFSLEACCQINLAVFALCHVSPPLRDNSASQLYICHKPLISPVPDTRCQLARHKLKLTQLSIYLIFAVLKVCVSTKLTGPGFIAVKAVWT